MHTAVFPNGNSASVVLASRSVGGSEARAALRLEIPRGLLILNGGTEQPPPEIAARLRSLFLDGLAPLVAEERLTVVTGGTDAGVFRLFGEALDGGGGAACIGVAPAGLVGRPSAEAIDTNGDRAGVPLESHHTHFLLVEGRSWGDETEAMLSLVAELSAEAPSLAVLAGGGSVSRRELLGHVRAGREVVVLAGSGRLADEIADAVGGRTAAEDAELAEIVSGRITVLDPEAPPSALAKLVRARLGSPGRPRRTPRSLALLAPLPRLRWRPVQGPPFVSESTLARCPALREETGLLEQELVPRFRSLDQESLRTQNAFRLGQVALVVGGVLAAGLGAVQAAAGGGGVALAIAEALVAGLLAGTAVYIRGRNAQRKYFTSRLAAERLRAEYFFVLAHAGDYAKLGETERLRLLRRRIRAIAATVEES